jgi:polygalacturonase
MLSLLSRMIVPFLTLCVALFFGKSNGHSVDDYGAIDGVDTWEASVHNAKVFYDVMNIANTDSNDRTVVFPVGKTYFLANNTFDGLKDISLQVEGTMRFSNEIRSYPLNNGGGRNALIHFTNSESIHVSGHGIIDGQGLNWWRLCYRGNFMIIFLHQVLLNH